MGINIDIYYLALFEKIDECKVCLINSKRTLEEILGWEYYFDVEDEDRVVYEENWLNVKPEHLVDVYQDYKSRKANMEAFDSDKILVQWKAPYPYHIIATHAFIYRESDLKLLMLIDWHREVSAFGFPCVDDDGNKNWGPMFTIKGPINANQAKHIRVSKK